MFTPMALGIPASIFLVKAAWDGVRILKKKGENLRGMIFKNSENKWIMKMHEQGLEQGVEYTPLPRHEQELASHKHLTNSV